MRRIILLAVIAISSQVCFSQASFGVKAGVNVNNLHATGNNGSAFHTTGFRMRPGFTFGATVSLKASESFYVQPEANFSSLSARDDYNNQTFNYSYINIPVLLKWRFSHSPVSIYAGPQLGFLTSASSKTSGGSKTDMKGDVTNVDFAGTAGFSAEMESGLTLDLRFQNDFINVLKVEDASSYTTRSQVVSFTIGYIFKAAKKN